MTRLPVFATLLVTLAFAAMVALGVWQLRRADEKHALLATYAANNARPEMAMAGVTRLDADVLFRRAAGNCLEPVSWSIEGGRAIGGTTGYRHIARCRTGAEGPGFAVDLGVSRDPAFRPRWNGGVVRGVIAEYPRHYSLVDQLARRLPPPEPVLIAATAAPGLEPTAPPSIDDVPNNHLAYAVQWFLFAGAAVVIYALALRRRGLGSADRRD